MSDHILFAGWKGVVHGFEKMSLELAQETTEILTKMAGDGLIKNAFRYQLDPHGGDLNHFLIIIGEAENLAKVRQNPEFRKCMIKASYCLEGYGLVDGVTGETDRKRMDILIDLFEK